MGFLTYISRDWPLVPISVFYTMGYLWPLYEWILVDSFRFSQPMVVLGGVLIIVGFSIEILARRQLVDKGHFPDAKSTKLIQIVDDHRLVTNGLFAHVRHPLYAGRLLWSIGWAILFTEILSLIFFALGSVFLIFRIRLEERMLVEKFGEEYERYKIRTPMIIPFLFKNRGVT